MKIGLLTFPRLTNTFSAGQPTLLAQKLEPSVLYLSPSKGEECLGSYSSLEEVKEIVLSKMREELKLKKPLTDEDLLKKFKKKYGVPFFVTKMKIDSDLFYLTFDGDYEIGYSIANKHRDLKWCLLFNEN